MGEATSMDSSDMSATDQASLKEMKSGHEALKREHADLKKRIEEEKVAFLNAQQELEKLKPELESGNDWDLRPLLRKDEQFKYPCKLSLLVHSSVPGKGGQKLTYHLKNEISTLQLMYLIKRDTELDISEQRVYFGGSVMKGADEVDQESGIALSSMRRKIWACGGEGVLLREPKKAQLMTEALDNLDPSDCDQNQGEEWKEVQQRVAEQIAIVKAAEEKGTQAEAKAKLGQHEEALREYVEAYNDLDAVTDPKMIGSKQKDFKAIAVEISKKLPNDPLRVHDHGLSIVSYEVTTCGSSSGSDGRGAGYSCEC